MIGLRLAEERRRVKVMQPVLQLKGLKQLAEELAMLLLVLLRLEVKVRSIMALVALLLEEELELQGRLPEVLQILT